MYPVVRLHEHTGCSTSTPSGWTFSQPPRKVILDKIEWIDFSLQMGIGISCRLDVSILVDSKYLDLKGIPRNFPISAFYNSVRYCTKGNVLEQDELYCGESEISLERLGLDKYFD